MTEVLARTIFIAAALTLASCQTAPTAQKPASPIVTAPVYEPEAGLTPRERLLRSLELLEEGDAERARVEVIAYLERIPRSAIARDLLLQIDTDPEVYYPSAYQEVTLQSGQSLSNVAMNYLGSAYEFYALARYNDIARPRRVVPGQVVRVPLTPEAVEAFARETVAGEEPGIDDSSAVDVLADDTTVDDELDGADLAESLPVQVDADSADAPVLPLEDDIEAVADVGTAAPIEEAEPEVPAIDADALHLWDKILAAEPGYESARLYRSQAIALKERLQRLQ